MKKTYEIKNNESASRKVGYDSLNAFLLYCKNIILK